MLFLYNLGIQLYRFIILFASLKNKKAAAWIAGRKSILHRIASQVDKDKRHAWFHFASLGEFEQGRPLLEEIKSNYPDLSIVITFFSPSGYEIQKNYENADYVFYLPLDTPGNAREFIQLVKPSIAVFTKYEYWYHYFKELHENRIPLFIVSGIFSEDQPFFKWYGGLHRKMLHMVTYFFVQNEHSKMLLNRLGFTNLSITGDTRFDRVLKNISNVTRIPAIENFCMGSKVFIAGSSWPADEALISSLPGKFANWKFIIAPHEIDTGHIKAIEKLFEDSIRFSDLKENNMVKQVLIIDNIGMLSSLYQYGDIAYIGGGFGVGIHNTQEAAAFGMPIIFGPHFNKFQEAIDLVNAGSSFSITTLEELVERMEFLQNEELRMGLAAIAKDYIVSKSGATQIIMNYLEKNGFFRL